MVDLSRVVDIRADKLTKLRRDEDAAQRLCQQARNAVFRARQHMDDYAESIRTLEIDLLTELMDTELTVVDFSEFEGRLKQAADKAIALADAHDDALAELREAETEVEKRRQDRHAAQSKLNRISELHGMLEDERKADRAWQEDAEIDAFVETMTGRGGVL